MAGHSQFKNIMHRKGAQDKKKAKVFNKIAREITVAAKSGSPDPETNSRLRNAIAAARVANMPNSRIKGAIDLANPDLAGNNFDEMRYEGYGPGGAAVIIEALTDNRNRTAAEVRGAFTKNGGALGESNSVSFMFSRIGQIIYPSAVTGFDSMFEASVEAGAENVEAVGDSYEITTRPEDFISAREALEKKFGPAQEGAGIIWKPLNTVAVSGEQAKDLMDLIEALEDSDDVQNVFSNFEMDEAVMEKMLAS